MPTQLGTAVNFAFGSAAGLTLTSPTITGILLQNAEHGLESDLATVRDGNGDVCTEIFHDQRATAQFVFKVSGSGIGAARTNTTLAAYPPGTILVVATCAARPDMIQTNWIVTESGPKASGGNSDCAEITVPLRRRAGITAVASA